jgi:hypothetical protein
MKFSSQFTSWLFYAILATSFTQTLLQPDDGELVTLIETFNKKVETIKADCSKDISANDATADEANGIQPIAIEGTNNATMLKFMASISNKYHQFFLAFEDFVNEVSKLYSEDEKLAEKWIKLSNFSKKCTDGKSRELAVFAYYFIKNKLWQIKIWNKQKFPH